MRISGYQNQEIIDNSGLWHQGTPISARPSTLCFAPLDRIAGAANEMIHRRYSDPETLRSLACI